MRMVRLSGVLLFAGLMLAVLAMPAASNAQIAVGVSIRVGPPALPVYAQPICPGAGYIWTPGYWAYGEEGYYWVPGTWVMAPAVGLLWTPGYWGFSDGVYAWHGGYWGPHVGFYGGINYGYGYTGVGFAGGEWRGREFAYNRSVTNVNVTVIHNYYNRTVVVREVNRVSYNGGPHGIRARASEREMAFARERHVEATRLQMEHEHAARSDRRQWASENHGRPNIAASGRPGDFHGRDVIAAREAHNHAVEANHGHMDRPRDNAHVEHRDMGRNDRPDHHDAPPARQIIARPNNARDAARDARPAPEAHGNPHADRGPAPHAQHENNGQDRKSVV